MIDLIALSKTTYEIAEQRQKNGANISISPLAMLKHCATEVVEAMEAYTKWCFTGKEQEPTAFSSELADIICCVLIIAGKEGIDIEQALRECYEKNKMRAEGNGDKK